jgi:hypothetical protein
MVAVAPLAVRSQAWAASTPPATACVIAKLKAIATGTTGELKCDAKAAATGGAPNASCLAAVRTKFAASFAKAEANAQKTGGQCPTVGDAVPVGSAIDSAVGGILSQFYPTQQRSKCAGKQMSLASKLIAKLLGAFATNSKTPSDGKLTPAVASTRASFAKSFDLVTSKGGCLETSSSGATLAGNGLMTAWDLSSHVGMPIPIVMKSETLQPNPDEGLPAVILDGTINVLVDEGMTGSVVAHYGPSGETTISANGASIVFSIGTHTLGLISGDPNDVVVDGAVESLDSAAAAFLSDVESAADAASWSIEGQAFLALSALVSTETWAYDTEVQRTQGAGTMLARVGGMPLASQDCGFTCQFQEWLNNWEDAINRIFGVTTTSRGVCLPQGTLSSPGCDYDTYWVWTVFVTTSRGTGTASFAGPFQATSPCGNVIQMYAGWTISVTGDASFTSGGFQTIPNGYLVSMNGSITNPPNNDHFLNGRIVSGSCSFETVFWTGVATGTF